MIYLLHFHERLGTPQHSAQHYLGWVKGSKRTVHDRLQEHRAGTGARITAACNEKGIPYDLVQCFPGDRNLERRIKNRKNLKRLCPVCSNMKKIF